MLSNLAFASRAVYSKAQMDKPVGENLGAANLYGILTIFAFLLSMPFFLYYELPKLGAAWAAAVAAKGSFWMWRQLFLDGLYYYAYNEVAFFTLSQVNPITHAIGVSQRARRARRATASDRAALRSPAEQVRARTAAGGPRLILPTARALRPHSAPQATRSSAWQSSRPPSSSSATPSPSSRSSAR
jgi:hypothetical protein